MLARAIFEERKGRNAGGNVYETIYRKEVFRMRVDFAKEMFSAVGLQLVDIAQDATDSQKQTIPKNVLEELMISNHRRWVIDRIINRHSDPIRNKNSEEDNVKDGKYSETDRKQISELPEFLGNIKYRLTKRTSHDT